MRRTADEVLRSLESRIARLERQSAFPEYPEYIEEHGMGDKWFGSVHESSTKEAHGLLLRAGFKFKGESRSNLYIDYTYKGARVSFGLSTLSRPDSLPEIKSFIRMIPKVESYVDQLVSYGETDPFYDNVIRGLKSATGGGAGHHLAAQFGMQLLTARGIRLHS